VITVNNAANGPGQYTTVLQALDSAVAGDTVYIHGSTLSYGNFVVNKRVTIFGTGYKPNKVNKLTSQVGTIIFDTLLNVSGGSGTKISGLVLDAVNGYNGTSGTSNVTISRNYFNASGTKINITGSGWIIENNILEPASINVNNNSNITLRNNIFSKSSIINSNQPTVLISNNVFLGNIPQKSFSNVSNTLIANNIFKGITPRDNGIDNNIFSNNITYQTALDTIPFGSNTGSGNIVAKNPDFVNVPSNVYNASYDYSLQATSLGVNAGTDGTDIGIYGGSTPFVDLTGSPAIPQINSITILNPLIPVGDSLQIIIKARKQN